VDNDIKIDLKKTYGRVWSGFFWFSLHTSWAVLNKVKARRGNSTWSAKCMEQSPCRMTAEKQEAVTRVESEDQGDSRYLPPCAEAQGSLACQKKSASAW